MCNDTIICSKKSLSIGIFLFLDIQFCHKKMTEFYIHDVRLTELYVLDDRLRRSTYNLRCTVIFILI